MRREPYLYKGTLAMPGSDLFAALADQDPKKAARLHRESEERHDKLMASLPGQRWPHHFSNEDMLILDVSEPTYCTHCEVLQHNNWRDRSLCPVVYARSLNGNPSAGELQALPPQ
jgi:hypothetical protein